MATKTVTTKSGKTITVELVRQVQDKVSYADGYNINVGREIIEYTNITFKDQSGKVLAKGKAIAPMSGSPSNVAKMKAQGAVARVGEAAISQEVVDQINAAFAELEAENPKSDEYLAIKQAQADALDRWETEAPERRKYEEFARKMDRADSDY